LDGEGLDGEGLDGEGLDGEGLDGEGLDGRRVDEEKLDEEKMDGRRLDREKLGPIETFRSVSPAEPAPNIKQPQVSPKKTGRLSKLALEFWKKLGDESDDEDHPSQIPPSQTPPPQIPSWERWALPFINLVCVVWSILSVELTTKWNNITEVHTIQSVGQLIPFVISIVGLLKLLRDISVQGTQLWIYEVVLVRYVLLNTYLILSV
jgi:hypothetical protein